MGSPDGIWHFIHGEVKVLVTHSDSLQPHGWPTRRLCLWNSPGRTLAWVALFFSRGSSWPRDRIPVSCTGRQILYYLSPLGSPSTPYWICYSVLNMRNMLFLNFKINKSQCISLFFFSIVFCASVSQMFISRAVLLRVWSETATGPQQE